MNALPLALASRLMFPLFLTFSLSCQAQGPWPFEAEGGSLSGGANIVDCTSASGGQMVRGLSGGTGNALEFTQIDLPQAGSYFITLSYLSATDRSFSYQINGGPVQTRSVLASGPWCYQGGGPRDFMFQDTFQNGINTLRFFDAPIIDKVEIATDTVARAPATFYLSSAGNDSLDGRSPATAWRSLARANALALVPGDSLLFQRGNTFVGQLALFGESGSSTQPIFIGAYGSGEKPILDGDGYLAAMHVQNSGYLHIDGLEFQNDGGPAQPGAPTELRYGLYLENTRTDGTAYRHFRLHDLSFRNIYPTDQITQNDQTGINAYGIMTSGSSGDPLFPTRWVDVELSHCYLTRIGRHAVRLLAIDSLYVHHNLFEHIGGAGMLIGGNCSNILVEHNTTDHTGSTIDPRMAGRGSGLWCYKTRRLVVQHNRFMHARGFKDSYGMHIDIGNREVVYQYNYSLNNEGGFVEILGDNHNVGYRYNLSIADGWRTRGNQPGKVFWLSDWAGNPPIGSDSIFIYNNSIYVPDTIVPNILIVANTQRTRIYNNLLYVAGSFGEVHIENAPNLNDIDHNLWYGPIPAIDTDGQAYRGASALTADPLLAAVPVTEPGGFFLGAGSPALGAGQLIFSAAHTGPYAGYTSHGGEDYFGNSLSAGAPPHIGAYNGPGGANALSAPSSERLKLYPNPVPAGQVVSLEGPSGIGPLQVQLIDPAGRVVRERRFHTSPDMQLDTSGLASGMHLVRLRAGGRAWRQKLVVE